MKKGLERSIEHYSHGGYDEYGVNTANSFNTPPKKPYLWNGSPPETYEEYMASGLVDRMWEAGFLAGRMFDLIQQHKKMNEQKEEE